ncbi:hypothetical protein ACFQ3S_00660 [Mucilaginibacter terrae]|uniref:hypothetical protein n=1 Tax=Mucilaginibacter terrae TaxID=1955052 RepID=UPI00362E56CB
MKQLIIITLLLLAATVVITVKYFNNLNSPGKRTNKAIKNIPLSAVFVFEFSNDGSFSDMYAKSDLFTAITGKAKMDELQTLHHSLLNNTVLKTYFGDQNIFISIHPQPNDSIDYLITLPSKTQINQEAITQFKQSKTSVSVKNINIAGKNGYEVTIDSLKRHFFLAEKGKDIWMGSFSMPLLQKGLTYISDEKPSLVWLPAQQGGTLGNLYVSYTQLNPLLNQLYQTGNTDIWKLLKLMPATTALSLNYKSDALMFNGFTTLDKKVFSYMSLFTGMKPVKNDLKNIFPITTAFSNDYAVDNVKRFLSLISNWQKKTGLSKDAVKLFNQIKTETGVQIDKEFNNLVDNEFAVVTTRFQERLGIIKVKNGALLKPLFNNISTMLDEETGQFNYNQVPLFLLGDVMAPFRKPYYMILDNYLILANTPRELSNYKENYLNNAFLSKGDEYIEFNNLLAQQSNICFFVHFKNAGNVFKRALKPAYAKIYLQQPGFKSYYAAAYQLSGSDQEFYTNLCLKLNMPDTVSVKK